MGMWHVTQKLILLVGLSLSETTQGGGQGLAYKVHGCGKSMLSSGSHLVWEGACMGTCMG